MYRDVLPIWFHMNKISLWSVRWPPFFPFHIHCNLSASCNHPVKADVQGNLNGCWKSSGHYYSGRCPVQGLWHGNMLLTCGTGLLGPQPLLYALNQQQEHNISFKFSYFVQGFQSSFTKDSISVPKRTSHGGQWHIWNIVRENEDELLGENNGSAATVSSNVE